MLFHLSDRLIGLSAIGAFLTAVFGAIFGWLLFPPLIFLNVNKVSARWTKGLMNSLWQSKWCPRKSSWRKAPNSTSGGRPCHSLSTSRCTFSMFRIPRMCLAAPCQLSRKSVHTFTGRLMIPGPFRRRRHWSFHRRQYREKTVLSISPDKTTVQYKQSQRFAFDYIASAPLSDNDDLTVLNVQMNVSAFY